MGKNRNRHRTRNKPKPTRVGSATSLGELYKDMFDRISERINKNQKKDKK
jgi:hypothetical protein